MSSTPSPPGLSTPPLRRAPGTVQFGVSPGKGLVVGGLTADEVDLICSWGRPGQVVGMPERRRRAMTPSARLSRVMAQLDAAGLLRPANQPEPTTADVTVLGTGPLAETITAVISEVVTTAHQVRLNAGAAAASGRLPQRGDLAILVSPRALSHVAGRPWRDLGVAHLPVIWERESATVGPLVTPGGPCLECLDLARAERDPVWPELIHQLTVLPDVAPTQIDPALRTTCAGLTAMLAAAHLRGAGWPPGLALEIALPDPEVRYRRWSRHPRCRGCRDQMAS